MALVKVGEDEGRRRRIERRVLEYVVDRPAAKDTVEGIRLWWLREEPDVPPLALHEVLADLAARNWLVVRPMARDSGEQANVYGLNAVEAAAIHAYLGQSKAASAALGPQDDAKEGVNG